MSNCAFNINISGALLHSESISFNPTNTNCIECCIASSRSGFRYSWDPLSGMIFSIPLGRETTSLSWTLVGSQGSGLAITTCSHVPNSSFVWTRDIKPIFLPFIIKGISNSLLILITSPLYFSKSQRGLVVSSKILRYFPCSGSQDLSRNFEGLRTFRKGRLEVFRPTRSSEFSRCWVMVS